MALKGLICPNGLEVTFDLCFNSPPCKERCHPLPVLMSLEDGRVFFPNSWSTTEMLQPPQIAILKRTHDYYMLPDDLMFATFGTAWHKLIEDTKGRLGHNMTRVFLDSPTHFSGHIFLFEEENYFEEEVLDGVYLTGTPDLYDVDRNILYDFKTTKYYYTLKYIMEKGWDKADTTYHWQINIYRRFKYPTAKMKMYCLVKDYARNMAEKGIHPTMNLTVPLIADDDVDNLVKKRLGHLTDCMDNDNNPRPCLTSEMWISKKGVPLRCTEYCAVNKFCPQYEEYMENGS